MVDIGQAQGTTEMSRVTVNEVPGVTTVIGAGTAGGPARKVDIFEDATVHGNLQAGICKAVRFYLPDGGSLSTETPRLSTEVANSELSIIGAGSTAPQYQRLVKVYDNLIVARDASVLNDVHVTHNAFVGNALQVTGISQLDGGVSVGGAVDTTGDVNVGEISHWHMVRAKNAVVAAATIHCYDLGAGIQVRALPGGFGFATTPGFYSVNANSPWSSVGPVLMLDLDAGVQDAWVSITPWVVGQYNTTAPIPVLEALQLALSPPVVLPTVTVKGSVIGPAGTIPDPTGTVQIEIACWGTAMTPVIVWPIANDGSGNRVDFMFDIVVHGSTVIM